MPASRFMTSDTPGENQHPFMARIALLVGLLQEMQRMFAVAGECVGRCLPLG